MARHTQESCSLQFCEGASCWSDLKSCWLYLKSEQRGHVQAATNAAPAKPPRLGNEARPGRLKRLMHKCCTVKVKCPS